MVKNLNKKRVHYEKVEKGMEFANYKVLALFIGDEVATGSKNKKLQLQEWDRWFEYEKETGGNKIMITQTKKDVIRQLDEVAIKPLLYMLLLKYAKNNKLSTHRLYFSRHVLLKELKMVNTNYIKNKGMKLGIAKFFDMSVPMVEDYLNNAKSSLGGKLNTSAMKLSGVTTLDTYCVWEWDNDDKKNATSRDISEKESKCLRAFERDLLQELDVASLNRLQGDKRNKYYEDLHKLMMKEFPYMKTFYRAYKFTFEVDVVKDMLKLYNKHTAKSELSSIIVQFLDNGAISRLDKAQNFVPTEKTKELSNTRVKILNESSYIEDSSVLHRNFHDAKATKNSTKVSKLDKLERKERKKQKVCISSSDEYKELFGV